MFKVTFPIALIVGAGSIIGAVMILLWPGPNAPPASVSWGILAAGVIMVSFSVETN